MAKAFPIKFGPLMTSGSSTTPSCKPNPNILIPIEAWAAANGVKPRTAKDWAQKGKIKASLRTVKVTFAIERPQAKYFVRAGAKKPDRVK